MGYSNPPDAYSGVKIGENTYPVMLRNDGCYVYFDENGKRHNLNDVPKADYEFVNIKDARTAIENQCYRTPGGMVELRIHTYMNNEDDVLSMRVVVINSTDVDNPIGTEMDEILAGMDPEKRRMFDPDYIEELYRAYRTEQKGRAL